MLSIITKNWRTTIFGIVLVVLGIFLLINHSDQIETAIGLIIGGLSQMFAKDGATDSEYIKEKLNLKNEIIDEATRKIHYLSTDELRAELDRRGRAE